MAKVDYATLKKGGFMRQKQKNNFSLRLACVGGALTAENLKKIAEVAEKYGDGYVHLTSRQGVEIPFIKLDDSRSCQRWMSSGCLWTESPHSNSLSGQCSLSKWKYQQL